MNVRRATPIANFDVATTWSWLARHYWIIACLLLCIALLNEIMLFGLDVTNWDSMYVSGTVTFIGGLGIALQMQRRTEEMLTRLADRGALKATPEGLAALNLLLKQRGDQWANRAGIGVAAATLIAFLLAFRVAAFLDQPIFTLVSVCGGYVAGRFFGRAASLMRLGSLFKQLRVTLEMQPAHLDGAAGLKPIGDRLFFQAMLIAIPAAYLAIWWVIIPALPQLNDRYSHWRDAYLGLLAIVLIFELLAFIVPMWFFHQEMESQKQRQFKAADNLSQQVTTLQSALVGASTEQDRKQLQEQIAVATERYWAIEQMPTWPVDPVTRKRFTVNNIALFIPLLSQFVHVTGIGSTLLTALTTILPKLSSQ